MRTSGLLLFVTASVALAADSKLADAMMNHDAVTLRTLLRQKADANVAQADGTTALHWAARWDDLESAGLLLKSGANAKAANRFGLRPLALACTNGSAQMIAKLLDAGEDANAILTPDGDTALQMASRAGKADGIRVLLDHGANVNQTNPRGQTALMWAVAEKNAEAAKLLLSRGANANAKTNPLPPPRPLDLIFSAPTPAGGMTALLFAARQNDMASAKALLEGGADMNLVSADGSSALLVAIVNEHNELAEFLLSKGADPNLADDRGRAALYAAIDLRNLEWSTRPAPPGKDKVDGLHVIETLLDHGADPNARLTGKIPLRGQPSFDGRWANQVGATPFWRAAQSDDVTVMRLLLAHKADPQIPSKDGTTPLMMAAGVGWSDGQSHGSTEEAPEAIRICIEQGLDVNAVNADGNTALHGASFRGAANVVQLLVAKGAKMDVKNKEGRMPINMAEGMHIGPGGWVEHEEIVALFKKLMAASAVKTTAQVQ